MDANGEKKVVKERGKRWLREEKEKESKKQRKDDKESESGLSQPTNALNVDADDNDESPQLWYESWNVDGLTEVKIKSMMPHWEGSNLIFIQETKLDLLQEQSIRDIHELTEYECLFHPAYERRKGSGFWNYGLGLFYKDVSVTLIDMSQTYPQIAPANRERIMMVEVECELSDEPIIFINLYLPANNTSRPERAQERQDWLATISYLCEILKDRKVVLLGDWNMRKQRKNKPPDNNSKLYSQYAEMFNNHGYLNISELLWTEDDESDILWTRHAPHPSDEEYHITSCLDYVVISYPMQIYNQTARPVYEMLHLSDHVSIKCSNRLSTDEYPPVPNLTPISCVSPVIGRGPKEHICPYCQKNCRSPKVLVIHIRTHTGEKPFLCKCGFRATQNSDLNAHKLICTGKSRLAKRRMQCANCKFHTVVMKDFENHVAKCVKKSLDGKYTCTPCQYSTDDKRDWEKHTNSKKHNMGSANVQYDCHPCNYHTRDKSQYKQHLTTAKHLKNTQ